MRKALVILLAAIITGAGGDAARASSQFTATFQVGFLSARPGVSAGLTTLITWSDPGAPGGAPKAIATIDLHFPAGTRLDTAALPTCGASDAEIKAQGAPACPPESRLGTGSTIGALASGTEFTTQVTLFNAPGAIIVLVTLNGALVTEFRDEVQRDAITVNPALPPGVSLKRLELRIDPRSIGSGAAEKAYLRTPPTCPASGRWAIVGTLAYADGSSQTLTSDSPCDKPKLRLSVRPRRVTARRGTHFRFRVTSLVAGTSRPVRGATVRFAERLARTDRRGSATIVRRLTHPGRYRALASKPGFASGRTLVVADRSVVRSG